MKTYSTSLLTLSVIILGLFGAITKANAHSVQAAYCATCDSKLRLYIEHWHGTEDPKSTTMTIDVNVGGVVTSYTGSPIDTIHNRPFAQLPNCAVPLKVFASCPTYANTYNDWVIYDFPNVPCNTDIVVTIKAGHTVFTQDACGYMPAATDTFQIPCGAIGNASFIAPTGFPLCAGDSHTFVNASTPANLNDFIWDFGHAGYDTSYAKNPSWKFPSGGTYPVTLSVGDSIGCFDDTTIMVTIEDSPLPNWTYNMGCAPYYQTDFLDGSSIASGSIGRYQWDFGIGGADHDTSAIPNPSWTYPQGGDYNVKLKLWSQNGCVDSLEQLVTIGNQPVAQVTWDTVCWDKGTPFHDLTTIIPAGTLGTWSWDFGDGDVSNEQNPTHNFPTAGLYNVKMLVTSASGCKDSVDLVVESYYEPPLVAPNVFTPNGDVKNDRFVIPEIDLHSKYLKYRGNMEGETDMEVWVYNRWGRKVYHNPHYDNTWDGKDTGGKLLGDGTYYYILKYNTYCYPQEGMEGEQSTVTLKKSTVTIMDAK